MSVTEPAYFTAFKNLAFSWTPSGRLTLMFHTDGGPAAGIQIAREEAVGLNRTRCLTLPQGSFAVQQAERWGAVAELLPLEQILPRAQELAATLAAKPQLLTGTRPSPCCSGSAVGWPRQSSSAWRLKVLPQPISPTRADNGSRPGQEEEQAMSFNMWTVESSTQSQQRRGQHVSAQ